MYASLSDSVRKQLAEQLAFTEEVKDFIYTNYSTDYLPDIMAKDTATASREWRECGLLQYSQLVQLALDLLTHAVGIFYVYPQDLITRVRANPIPRQKKITRGQFQALGQELVPNVASNAAVLEVSKKWTRTE